MLQTVCDGSADGIGMIYVASGELRAYTVSDQGREITLFRVAPQRCCVVAVSCLPPQRRFSLQLTVSADAELLIVPAPSFCKLAQENLHVRCFLFECAATQSATIIDVMEEILFARFDQRLAAFFLEQYAQSGSTRICMTQEQIAQNVNSAREVVARMLKQFDAEGLIENRRGQVLLKNLDGLRAKS